MQEAHPPSGHPPSDGAAALFFLAALAFTLFCTATSPASTRNAPGAKIKIVTGRFQEFFEQEGIDSAIASEFNQKYQICLGDTIVYCDNSFQIVKSLQGKVRQYVVSNGTIVAQTKKLNRSGLGALMDGIFLSEQIGAEKPNLEFFDKVFETIGDIDRNQTMIIGDSLTSDICGGNRAGIITCWYNPEKAEKRENVYVDYEITDLHEVYRILS